MKDLATALAKAQREMRGAEKDAKNPHFKSNYATLASIIDAIQEPLAKNGLSYTQTFKYDNSIVLLNTKLMHESGDSVDSIYPVLPSRTDPQGYGSAITYARRYCLAAIVGIAQVDDDANDASQKIPKNTQHPMVEAFKKFNVTKEEIESICGGPIDKASELTMKNIREIYKQISTGKATKEAFFNENARLESIHT